MTLHVAVQRTLYATPGSQLNCTYCGTNWILLYEYARRGDETGGIFRGLFCSDRCFHAFHHIDGDPLLASNANSAVDASVRSSAYYSTIAKRF
jgi:hypothetical protein